MSTPEVWLRGPIPAVPTQLQSVAHALLQALEDVERASISLPTEELWAMPGGAASVGFHLRHMAGSLDRLLTYARGEELTDEQRSALAVEKDVASAAGTQDLLGRLREVIELGIDQLRGTSDDALDEPREVGRARLPSSVRGLLHHAAEHTARHAGQIITTVRITQGTKQ